MRLLLSCAFVMLCGLSSARADVLPDCPEGQMPDCTPSEHHHGCGGCVDDPDYEGSGCAVGGASALSGGMMLIGLVLVRRRER